jgi:hypothetical protein
MLDHDQLDVDPVGGVKAGQPVVVEAVGEVEREYRRALLDRNLDEELADVLGLFVYRDPTSVR